MLLPDAQAVEKLADDPRTEWENQVRVACDNTFPVDTIVETLRNFVLLRRGTRTKPRETGTGDAEATGPATRTFTEILRVHSAPT